MSGHIAETVRGIIDIKCLAGEAWREAGFRQGITHLRDLRVRMHMLISGVSHAGTLLSSLAPLAVLCVGSLMIIEGHLTMGSLVAFTTICVRLYTPLDSLAGINVEYRSIFGAVERIAKLMSRFEAEPAVSGRMPQVVNWGVIRFERVDFRYQPDGPWIMRDFSLSIEQGERLALVGDNGTGKTTVARLIPGLIEPEAGHVLIDGVDVTDIPRTELRKKIAFVSGDSYIFNATLRDNILLACPHASDHQILEILDELGLVTDGLSLDSQLGEAGIRLSLGQRQRLALARVLINEPAVLIIDEATSSLDADFERWLLEMVDRRFAGRTVVFIAHRESSLASATRRCILKRPR